MSLDQVKAALISWAECLGRTAVQAVMEYDNGAIAFQEEAKKHEWGLAHELLFREWKADCPVEEKAYKETLEKVEEKHDRVLHSADLFRKTYVQAKMDAIKDTGWAYTAEAPTARFEYLKATAKEYGYNQGYEIAQAVMTEDADNISLKPEELEKERDAKKWGDGCAEAYADIQENWMQCADSFWIQYASEIREFSKIDDWAIDDLGEAFDEGETEGIAAALKEEGWKQ